MGEKAMRVRQAKASKDDIERAFHLSCLLMELFPSGPVPSHLGDDPFDSESLEDLQKLFSELEKTSDGIHRVVACCSVMIDNACDPDDSCLEWKPEIEKAMKAAEAFENASEAAKIVRSGEDTIDSAVSFVSVHANCLDDTQLLGEITGPAGEKMQIQLVVTAELEDFMEVG